MAFQPDHSRSGRGDPGQNLQQRALPRAVAPHDAHDLSLPDLEVHASEGPDGIPPLEGALVVGPRLGTTTRLVRPSADVVAQRPATDDTQTVMLRQILYLNDLGHHRLDCQTVSMKVRSIRLRSDPADTSQP